MSYNVDKMYTYLRGFLMGAKMNSSLKALQMARDKHSGQVRKSGEPYIIHPLTMACYGIAIGIKDDNIIATALLHDVVEDCNTTLDLLPFNDTIKRAIKYMTITPFDNEDKSVTKKRYFTEMADCREAVIVKGLDRYHNLSTMAGNMPIESIEKNIKETDEYILPMLKEAKEKWVDLSDILFILRTNIRDLNETLKVLVDFNKKI